MELSLLASAAILLAFNPVVLANSYDVYAAAVCALCYLCIAAVIYGVTLIFLLAIVPRVTLAVARTRVDTYLPLRCLSAVAICILDFLDFWIYGLSRKGWVPLLSVAWSVRALITGQGMCIHLTIIE